MSDTFFWTTMAVISGVNVCLWFWVYQEHRRKLELFVLCVSVGLLGAALWNGWAR